MQPANTEEEKQREAAAKAKDAEDPAEDEEDESNSRESVLLTLGNAIGRHPTGICFRLSRVEPFPSTLSFLERARVSSRRRWPARRTTDTSWS